MKVAMKPDGTPYYVYALLCIDDVLCFYHRLHDLIKTLKRTYKLKDRSVGPSNVYLGAKIKPYYLPDSDNLGKVCWSMFSKAYVKQAIKDVESELQKVGKSFPKKVLRPLSAG
jgi:hypothetical protein